MKFTINNKELGMARVRLHPLNLRLGNFVWVGVDPYRLGEEHLRKVESIKAVLLDKEMLFYLGFKQPDPVGYCRHSKLEELALKFERNESTRFSGGKVDECFICWKGVKIPQPVKHAHQVQNVVYYLTGHEI